MAKGVAETQPLEVLDAVRRVEQRGALDVANRLLQRCAAVFRYAAQTLLAMRLLTLTFVRPGEFAARAGPSLTKTRGNGASPPSA